MRTIIDTHTHLYELSDPLAVMAESAASGVSEVIALGVDLASNRRHLDLFSLLRAEREETPSADKIYAGLHVALGLHPGNITAGEIEDCFPLFRKALSEPSGRSIVALGETGLDYWYKWVRKDEARKREQREVFERHLALAREFDLPAVLHSRGAWRDCLDVLRASGVTRANFHWYSGPADVLRDLLDSGFMISCTPSLAYSSEARQAVIYAPLDRILVETDTPVGYPPPAPDAGIGPAGTAGAREPLPFAAKVPSAPKDVWRTLSLLSALKAAPEDAVLEQVNTNARRFFGL